MEDKPFVPQIHLISNILSFISEHNPGIRVTSSQLNAVIRSADAIKEAIEEGNVRAGEEEEQQ